ncbi:MAG TPA: HI0074 family nucleotidyltransferase substrate-binding subunit [Patescibacteria group bacterium]|jgi:nucleotidyltransferase substrate binding protein (TIGR01987 family)|nr:HI0074 family nucleotidyltransferase substrate-binding subunit [Patescibacteria group bacterium]
MQSVTYSININPLKKAFVKLQQFSKHLNTEQEKAGAIQAFEYSFELSWKIMKRFLSVRGREANSPREVFRIAALEKFIEDPEVWFDFLEKRNLTVHTYQENEAEAVISVLPLFVTEVEKLIAILEKL